MTAVPTTLRETGPADLEAIPRVQREAFGRDTEAALTEALLADATTRPALSLLALRGAEAAGHILFTAQRLAREQGCEEGFRVVMNCNDLGGQTVHHIHMHVLGQRQMHWPPG